MRRARNKERLLRRAAGPLEGRRRALSEQAAATEGGEDFGGGVVVLAPEEEPEEESTGEAVFSFSSAIACAPGRGGAAGAAAEARAPQRRGNDWRRSNGSCRAAARKSPRRTACVSAMNLSHWTMASSNSRILWFWLSQVLRGGGRRSGAAVGTVPSQGALLPPAETRKRA